MKGAVRRRYSLFISWGYIVAGMIIVGRSVLAHVLQVAVLGIVLIALGAVRIRDYLAWRRMSVDS